MALHRNLQLSVTALKKDLVRTVFYLQAAFEAKIHKVLGHSRFRDYAARYAGLTPRQTADLLYLGRRLRLLPQIASALESGDLTWEQARQITRRATADDQQAWLDAARNLSWRELDQTVSSGADPQGAVATPPAVGGLPAAPALAPPAGPPTAPPSPPEALPMSPSLSPSGPLPTRQVDASVPLAPEVCHLPLRFTPEQMARWDGLMGELWQGDRDGRISKEERVLDGLTLLVESAQGTRPTEEDCRKGAAQPRRDPAYLVILLESDVGKASIVTSRGESPASQALLGAVRCDSIVEGPDGHRGRTIPRRLRRRALQKARGRCEAAGCLHTQRLEVHHRVPLALGGCTELDNLIVLCRRCHRRLHKGEQQIQTSILAAELAARALRSAPK